MGAEKKNLKDINTLAKLCKRQFEITADNKYHAFYDEADDAYEAIKEVVDLADQLGFSNKAFLEKNAALVPPEHFRDHGEYKNAVQHYNNIANGIIRRITSTRQTDRHPKVVRKQKHGVSLPSITDFS